MYIYEKLDEQIQVDRGFITDTFTCILSYYRELILQQHTKKSTCEFQNDSFAGDDWIAHTKHVPLPLRALFTLRATIPPLPLPPLTTKVSPANTTPLNFSLPLFTLITPKPTAAESSLPFRHTLSNPRCGSRWRSFNPRRRPHPSRYTSRTASPTELAELTSSHA